MQQGYIQHANGKWGKCITPFWRKIPGSDIACREVVPLIKLHHTGEVGEGLSEFWHEDDVVAYCFVDSTGR